jgi:hypothetical protein
MKKTFDREITLTRGSRWEEAIFLIDRVPTNEKSLVAGWTGRPMGRSSFFRWRRSKSR